MASPVERWGLLNWWLQRPLVGVWSRMSGPARSDGVILRFWIKAAESDAWTFDQLGTLLDSMLDDAPPPDLERWGLEVAAGRRPRPAERRGRKGDRLTDFALAIEALWRHAVDGERKGDIWADMMERDGMPGTEKGVRDAIARGHRVPKEM